MTEKEDADETPDDVPKDLIPVRAVPIDDQMRRNLIRKLDVADD